MSKQNQDEYVIWGMTRKGIRLRTIKGFTNDWNKIREQYVKDNPGVIFIRMEFALPDKEAIAAGETNGQLAEAKLAGESKVMQYGNSSDMREPFLKGKANE